MPGDFKRETIEDGFSLTGDGNRSLVGVRSKDELWYFRPTLVDFTLVLDGRARRRGLRPLLSLMEGRTRSDVVEFVGEVKV